MYFTKLRKNMSTFVLRAARNYEVIVMVTNFTNSLNLATPRLVLFRALTILLINTHYFSRKKAALEITFNRITVAKTNFQYIYCNCSKAVKFKLGAKMCYLNRVNLVIWRTHSWPLSLDNIEIHYAREKSLTVIFSLVLVYQCENLSTIVKKSQIGETHS